MEENVCFKTEKMFKKYYLSFFNLIIIEECLFIEGHIMLFYATTRGKIAFLLKNLKLKFVAFFFYFMV